MLFKKWWFYVIVAVVIIIIAVPLSTIIKLNNSVYDDLAFNYVETDNLLTEIAKKHLYYDASTKTVEVEINQDLINSLIKDQLAQLDLGLPKQFSIQEVAFKTADQRVYVNAKYGAISLPISAKIFIEPNDTGITISAGEINLGKKKAPKFVTKRIPTDQLKYEIKYADLGVPQVFTIKEIKYSTGNLNAFIQLDVDAIKGLVKDYVDDLEVEINSFKRTAPEAVATFIDRALAEGILSDANIEKYVDDVLNNEELVNSAIYFALAPDLDKYAKGVEKYRQAIVEWAEPINTIKLDGSVDEIVESIIANDKLHDMLAWFIPSATLSEYVDTADFYYTIYKNAEGSLNNLGAALQSGDFDTAVKQLVADKELHQALGMVIPAATISDYVGKINSYYSIYKKAESSFNKLSAALQSGDIEKAINMIVADKDLYQTLTMVIPAGSIDSYLDQIQGYYDMYADITNSITELLESIPDDEITEYVNQAVEYAYEIENGQQYILDILAGVDTKYIKDMVYYLNEDEYIRSQMELMGPESYDTFMAYVDDLDTVKSEIITAIKSADVAAIKEGANIIKNINSDLVYVLDLLRDQQYEKAGDAINKIRFNDAEKFIEKQSQKLSASAK